MKTLYITALALAFSAIQFSCTSSQQNVISNNNPIMNNFWRLNKMKNFDVPTGPNIVAPYMDFNMSNFSGHSICNIYNGTYSITDKNKINLKNITALKRKCSSDASLAFDEKFHSILETVNGWRIENGMLLLLVNNDPQLYFTPFQR